MASELLQHLRKYVKIDTKDESDISHFFQEKTFEKKDILIEQNTRCRFHFFVIKGCLRMFFLNEKGVEQTIQFAIENWWITDYMPFDRQARTEFTIQAVEPSDVVQIDNENQK